MKIATYNVRNLFDPGTFIDDRGGDVVEEGFFNERISYFTQVLRDADLDIVCLQEIGGEKGVRMIGEALSYDCFFAKPNKRGIRMAALYKKELSSSITCESVSFGELTIPPIETRGDTDSLKPIMQRRDILEITLTTAEKTISINTFHLKSNLPQYLEDDDVENDANAYTDAKFRCIFFKTMELCALRRHVTERLLNGKEVILLGDYNENNTASIMDILKSSSRGKEELRLHDTLNDYKGDATTHIHRGGRLTFDTILVSQGIKEKIVSVHVANETLRDYSMFAPGAIEQEVESDHAMVFVEIA